MFARSTFVTLCTVLVLLAPAVAADHPAGTTIDWVLSAADAADAEGLPDAPGGARVQYRNTGTETHFPDPAPSSGPTGTIVVVNGCQTWVGDEPAALSFTVAGQTLEWELVFTAISDAVQDVTVEVGVQPAGGAFASHGSATVAAATVTTAILTSAPVQGTLDVTAIPFAAGDMLATRVCANTASEAVTGQTSIETGEGQSLVRFTDMGATPWPVPELATLLFSVLGVAAVGGVVLVRRRRS